MHFEAEYIDVIILMTIACDDVGVSDAKRSK